MLRYASAMLAATVGALLIRERRERRIRRSVERLGAATLETLVDTVEANNPATGGHMRRVAGYALILADAADMDERECRSVERVALFHDIGKIDGALTDIINDTHGLSAEEMRAVRTHPRRGADVLRPLAGFYPDLPEGVLSHHERWDGTGYPRCLRGQSIPVTARVVAIADTFDVVTHARSYSHPRTLADAISVIASGRGTQFDPDLADLFLSPPVMDRVQDALCAAQSPRSASGKRGRASPPHEDLPDLSFRWRTPARQRPSADRQR